MRGWTMIARNLAQRRVRTALTVSGLAIGIAAVVALLGIAWGFERSFLAIYEAKGIDLVVVRAGVSDRLTSNLDAALGGKLRRMPGVRDVAGSLMDAVSFEEANLVSVLVNGWEAGSLLFKGIRMLDGRPFRADEPRGAMLGRFLALNLGKKVGDRVDIVGEPFAVVGIFESENLLENGGVIIPLRAHQAMMGREGQVTGFVLAADRPDDRSALEALGRRIERELPGTAASPARDYVQGDMQIRLAKTMAWSTSVVALLLGALGVLNTMVMAVFERTREIGVLRALGWRRRRVLALILGESLALGLIGATFGTGLAFAGVRVLAGLPSTGGFISPHLPPAAVALGLGLGVSLSVVGGLYPALRGAGLDPTEALRHE